MKKYDAIIIGSGQAGNPLAKRWAESNRRVAIIERKLVGGTCINYGCTPTKAMIASAKNAFQARRSAEYGVSSGEVTIDMPLIIARKDKISADFRNSTEKGLNDNSNIDLVFGEAAFSGYKHVTVTAAGGRQEEYTADHVFINSGARAAMPDIKGLNKVPYLTSTTIMEITEIPEHLLIIGAGYVALEFGQMFRRFGSKVTMLSRSSRFLPKEDPDVAGGLNAILKAEGVNIYTGAIPGEVSPGSNGTISVIAQVDGKMQRFTATHLLLATGRTPNTEQLHLTKTGVETDDAGYIKVNDRLETTAKNIYALGDVKGGPAFTHISYNDYIVVSRNLLENAGMSVKGRPVPYCIFTDPEFARVGISEEEARKNKLNYKVAKLKMEYVARAIETGETKGFIKAIVDAGTKNILGVAVLGAQGGEIMSMLQIAMLGNIPYDRLRDHIFAHPTFSESINNLFMTFDNNSE